eukprot:gene2652-3058_t
MPKVLFVLSSHGELGNSGKKTGWYLSEASHPWESLTKKGFEVDFVSPKGGAPPLDPSSNDVEKDLVNKAFMEDKEVAQKLKNTLSPDKVNPKDYICIHYVGGHGVMWDVVDDSKLLEIARTIYEDQGGVVSAVCHGPSGIFNIKLKNGSYLVADKHVAAFTNAEEEAVGLTKVVPYSLQDRLQERGAIVTVGDLWSSTCRVDGRLVTGQNPQSAKELGEKLTDLLSQALEHPTR